MIRKILDRLYLFCGYASAISIIAMTLLVLAQIIARFFSVNIPSSDDISGYMVAWSMFFGLSFALKNHSHISVDLFVNMCEPKFKRLLTISSYLIGVILIGFLAYYVFLFVRESYVFEDKTSGQIPMPLWMIQSPMVAGVFILEIALIDGLFNIVKEKTQ